MAVNKLRRASWVLGSKVKDQIPGFWRLAAIIVIIKCRGGVYPRPPGIKTDRAGKNPALLIKVDNYIAVCQAAVLEEHPPGTDFDLWKTALDHFIVILAAAKGLHLG